MKTARGPINIVHPGSLGKVATIADNAQDQRIACANARLIAAAPDLLTALEQVMKWVDCGCDPSAKSAEAARAAIAKAKGGAL